MLVVGDQDRTSSPGQRRKLAIIGIWNLTKLLRMRGGYHLMLRPKEVGYGLAAQRGNPLHYPFNLPARPIVPNHPEAALLHAVDDARRRASRIEAGGDKDIRVQDHWRRRHPAAPCTYAGP